jgi:PhoH-like ATPase
MPSNAFKREKKGCFIIESKKKIYVLDTNVLIQSPYSLFAFDDNEVVLADVTLEELDNLKTRPADVGANARESNRILEELRQSGNLVNGVTLRNGGLLRIEVNHLNCELPAHWDDDKADNRILKVCKGISEDESKKEDPRQVILVT